MNIKNNKSIESITKKDKETALHYMKTLVDVARESFLILDADLEVVSANQIFYQTFRVLPEQIEGRSLYELGNGQWNIPELKKLLEEILPEKKAVRDYEVRHIFETIGEKTMVLNARQIDRVQLIILAIEDETARSELKRKLAEYAKDLEIKVKERTAKLEEQVKELEILNDTMIGRELKIAELKKEIENLKKK